MNILVLYFGVYFNLILIYVHARDAVHYWTQVSPQYTNILAVKQNYGRGLSLIIVYGRGFVVYSDYGPWAGDPPNNHGP